MEESLNLLSKLKKEFDCKAVDIKTYSPLTLAFIGDCVFDLYIRTILVAKGNRQPEVLHKHKSKIVKAATQAQMAESLAEYLTEDEADAYRRGRNAKSFSTAKNASVTDYRKATGFEALIGFLYLTDQEDRIIELVKKAIEINDISV